MVGEYEYSTKDLIGHGAFAVVFKGRHRQVSTGVGRLTSRWVHEGGVRHSCLILSDFRV